MDSHLKSRKKKIIILLQRIMRIMIKAMITKMKIMEKEIITAIMKPSKIKKRNQ